MKQELTIDELWDLAELACDHADRNDDDPEYCDKYTALYEKVLVIIKQEKANEQVNT